MLFNQQHATDAEKTTMLQHSYKARHACDVWWGLTALPGHNLLDKGSMGLPRDLSATWQNGSLSAATCSLRIICARMYTL